MEKKFWKKKAAQVRKKISMAKKYEKPSNKSSLLQINFNSAKLLINHCSKN